VRGPERDRTVQQRMSSMPWLLQAAGFDSDRSRKHMLIQLVMEGDE
jgi:hypothetical protein